MTTTHFTGPLEIGASASAGRPVETRVLSLVPTAATTTDLTLALPACRILNFRQRTTTAFTGNTVTLALGSTAGGAEFVAATDIKAKAANRTLTQVDTAADSLAAFAGGTLYARIAQTATVTAVGAGELVVEFVRTGDV
jgi:hypothetical protein